MIARCENAGDLVLQVEAFAEHQGRHYCAATSQTRGVKSSSGPSADPPVASIAISIRPRNSSSDIVVETACSTEGAGASTRVITGADVRLGSKCTACPAKRPVMSPAAAAPAIHRVAGRLRGDCTLARLNGKLMRRAG